MFLNNATLLTYQLLPLAQAEPAAGAPDSIKPMVLMVGSIIIFGYLLLFRPQKEEQKKRDTMMNTLAKGDQIVTIGGIHGSIEAIDVSNGTVTVTIAPKTTVKLNRTAIASVTKSKSGSNGKGTEGNAS